MKKNFKKFIALLLSVLMLMSVMAVGASAEDATVEAQPEAETHRGFIEIFIDFFMEFIGFIKYIFYDVFRGEPA